jgi:hypothetical protein
MQTETVNVMKKNRKFFKISIKGFECRLKIDDNTESLQLGVQTLVLEDVSVRTKYGTDVIYQLNGSVEAQSNGICTLSVPFYNHMLVDQCRNLGGRWDSESKTWVFNQMVQDEVDELDDKFNSELVTVDLFFGDDLMSDCGPFTYRGFTLAQAWCRDSGAKLGDGVALLSGKINSGGSFKNWGTRISEGTKLRLQVPGALLTETEIKNLEDTGVITITYNSDC